MRLQRVPEGFHHEPVSKNVAVPTDIDDGKPGAYNLPPPSTAGAIAAPAPAKDKDGKPLQNGALAEDDEARWVERTGWAPRFGNPASIGDEANPADHQTWVEGKLDDKFFGGI